MDRKQPDANPPPPPLPGRVTDFFNKVAPRADRSPLSELQERYREKRAEDRRALQGTPPMPNFHGTEYIVELRIREWMMRMEKEQRDAAKHKPKPPQA
ncbi:MAG TPA: hypothetical protein VEF76_14355 [Patescibacteria group bacterium]|nr:hypothetical protein [Patescibacteria group bacterium]